ncbi:MAG: hypothetical protein M3Y09_01835 [Actinomycetota bacterium]|nr:hypothetical protein [Actinomycetota bacterium]
MFDADEPQLSETSAPAGPQNVDAPVYCVLTRFGLRGPRQLLPTYRDYASLAGEARAGAVPGLLQCAFLVENPRTCYSLSLWSSPPFFSADMPAHVSAVRRVFGRLRFDPARGPELWSTQWKLTTVTNNLNWEGFDLRPALGLTDAGG